MTQNDIALKISSFWYELYTKFTQGHSTVSASLALKARTKSIVLYDRVLNQDTNFSDKYHLQLHYLYFRKTHKETGTVFEEPFSDKNCPGWIHTPRIELEAKAQARVAYWNHKLKAWHYEIVGWRFQ